MVVPLQLASALRARGYEAEVWYLYRQSPAYEDEPGVRLIYPDRPNGILAYIGIFFRVLRARIGKRKGGVSVDAAPDVPRELPLASAEATPQSASRKG